MSIELIYLGLLAVMSVVTFTMYAWDKRRARRQGWRVTEKSLHLAELLGGWPGGMAGRWLLRHKSRKLSFRAVSWAIVALHVGLIGAWVWYRLG